MLSLRKAALVTWPGEVCPFPFVELAHEEPDTVPADDPPATEPGLGDADTLECAACEERAALVAQAEQALRAEQAARADLERARAEALEEGFAAGRTDGWGDGYTAGLEEGRAAGEAAEGARLQTALTALEVALSEVGEAERHWVEAAEENICALATAVARQILDRELSGSTPAFAELVRRALAEFPLDDRVRIRVHPSDLAAITAMSGPGAESLSMTGGREAAWIADMDVGRGGCVVEGRSRIVDGRVDIALERVYRRLTYHNA